LNLEQNALATAQGANVGELFQYAIESPVTLPRHQSAMLPIVQESVKGEKVSIYNAQVQATHPLNGLRLTNSTKLHLQQGPITVFDDGVYAGDARIEDLPPGAERLLSYALDLDTEVASQSKQQADELTSVKITKGLLETSQKYERTVEYTVKNSGGKTKQVLIEYPRSADWKLVQPAKPTEKTRDMYRFAVTAKPDAPAKLLVAEEQLMRQQIVLTNLNETAIQFYVSSKAVSEPVKAALGELVQKKRDLQSLQQRNTQLQARINAISQEQGRIRNNMQQLDRTSDLYLRYVKKLNEQEDEIEKDRTQSDDLQQQVSKAQSALDDYLANLNVG
jgi:DNA repair exonuclease SbcCD ATPase subunit